MTKLLSVEAARARMLEGIGSGAVERVPTPGAVGRVLAEPVRAFRDQPPFDASAMDGWAIHSASAESEAVDLAIVGESAAGRPFEGALGEGEAVRIFTGAPVPLGATRVAPQEVAERHGERVALGPLQTAPRHIRPRGGDFRADQALLAPGVRLDPWRLALAASAGAAEVAVAPRPTVSLIATGEEVVPLGGARPTGSQIYDSASYAIAARVEQWGGHSLGITLAGDEAAAIVRAVEGAVGNLLIFIGGASVGDYDLIKPTLQARFGLTLSVESVNVRPGKPTWFGRLEDGRPVLGLPGNPASALVCAELFLGPLLLAWQGAARGTPLTRTRLHQPMPPTGPREHWMRARINVDEAGVCWADVFPDQDSSLVSVFAQADALIRRPAGASSAEAGASVEALMLQRL